MTFFSVRGLSALALRGFVGFVVACGGRTVDDDQFREDTLGCEDALAHLEACCPGFDTSVVACRYYDEKFESGAGCVHTVRHEEPTLDTRESECIRGKTCTDLVASGTCDRAQGDLPTRTTSTERREALCK